MLTSLQLTTVAAMMLFVYCVLTTPNQSTSPSLVAPINFNPTLHDASKHRSLFLSSDASSEEDSSEDEENTKYASTLHPTTLLTLAPLSVDVIETIVEKILITPYEGVDLIGVIINSDINVVVLIAMGSETKLLTETIITDVGEALEEEYERHIEVALIITNGKSEDEEIVSNPVILLLGIIGALSSCCCILSLIAFWCWRKNRYNQQNIAKWQRTRVASISANDDVDSRDKYDVQF